ncbi:MAG: GC-type dockerin domain-anchored protein [Phycisphaerales bacterium]
MLQVDTGAPRARCWSWIGAAILLMFCCAAPAAAQDCEPAFAEGLFLPPGVSGDVRDAVVWDDGRGPALYLAGEFFSAGDTATTLVARWDGQTWESLTSITGSQLSGEEVNALAVFDDGGGPDLYAGGIFSRAGGLTATNIAKWDGRTWREVEGSLGQGINGRVDCMHVHADATGTALYVGGQFDRAGGVSASNIARWDGSEWSRLGSGFAAGVDAAVFAMETFDDGSGPDLYVGGAFTSVTGIGSARYIARWDGSAWSAVGSGADGGVRALRTIVADGRPYLYIGGAFQTIGGVSASLIARFDGNDWRPIGDGLEGSEVSDILPFDDGRGRVLFVGGSLDKPGSRGEDVGILGWDGQAWSAPNGGVSRFVRTLTEFQGRLVVAGRFEWTIDGGSMNHVATWGADGWQSLGNGFDPGTVQAFETFDSGEGPELFVGGHFASVAGRPAGAIARWNGSRWLPSPPALRSPGQTRVLDMLSFDDGSGPALYVSGDFTRAGNHAQAMNIARWDGRRWSVVGDGFNGIVDALLIHDDGNGPRLYAGGRFTASGNNTMLHVARWTGDQWEAVRAQGDEGINGEVYTMASWNGDLYVGGRFSAAGSVAASNIARWDGIRWTAVDSGVNGPVNALAIFDDGGSEALFAAGEFTDAGPLQAEGIARWDGAVWTDLDGGLDGEGNTLLVHDDGTGPALYVGGPFSGVGPVDDRIQAGGLAAWSDAGWRGVTDFVSGEILTLANHRDDDGQALWVGGRFGRIDGVVSARIARRSVCPDPCPADFDEDGSLTVFDFLAFQSAFALGEPAADLDLDGQLTLFDFLTFQSTFARGCS